jgi:hypothetical protein
LSLTFSAFLCLGAGFASAQSLTLTEARRLVPEKVWPRKGRNEVTQLGVFPAGKRSFWAAHLFSISPEELRHKDIHGECRLVILECVNGKWAYLGHYLVDCVSAVRREGNRIVYPYEDKDRSVILDEKGPPADLKFYYTFERQFVFIR